MLASIASTSSFVQAIIMKSKTWITWLSLSLNGLFVVAWLFAALVQPDAGAGSQPSRPAPPTVPPTDAGRTAFRWQQIEADDFPTFIENLRRIGCPDSTIQGIVKGELAQVYAARRMELQSDEEVSQSELEKIEAEEAAALAALMADPSSPAKVEADVQEAPPAQRSSATLIPAAFAVGNDPNEGPLTGTDTLPLAPNDSTLDPGTAQVIGDLRSQFAESVRAAGAEPTSKTYLQSWMNAQRVSDERFSSMFGGDLFVRTQTRAAQEAAAAARDQGQSK